MLPIKKIYIDSRFKSSDSASDSDFKVDLPTTLLMPEDTGFYIDDVCIPHTWFPIEKNLNDTVVFHFDHIVWTATISPGNYTVKDLGVEIVTRMNNACGGTVFVSAYTTKTNSLTIKTLSDSVAFDISTDEAIREYFGSLVGGSVNSILKNFTPKGYNSNPFVSGYVDLYPIRNIYLTSSGLGNFNTMTVTGDRNVIKKIPVNAGHGEVIFDQTVTGMDYLDCSHQTLSRLSFH
jgi:hypothetical protein